MSISELVIVALVALIVFGPDKLPGLFYNAGKLFGIWRETVDACHLQIKKIGFTGEAKERKKKSADALDELEKKLKDKGK